MIKGPIKVIHTRDTPNQLINANVAFSFLWVPLSALKIQHYYDWMIHPLLRTAENMKSSSVFDVGAEAKVDELRVVPSGPVK